MYLNNVGIRKIALFSGVSPTGVIKWIKNAHKLLTKFEYLVTDAKALNQLDDQLATRK